jgi:hypothetical protein
MAATGNSCFCKITAIKTLALPKLIHLLTSLPNLPQAQINDLNSLFYNCHMEREIALISLIFLVKFTSVIQFKSSEKSIPKTLKFS